LRAVYIAERGVNARGKPHKRAMFLPRRNRKFCGKSPGGKTMNLPETRFWLLAGDPPLRRDAGEWAVVTERKTRERPFHCSLIYPAQAGRVNRQANASSFHKKAEKSYKTGNRRRATLYAWKEPTSFFVLYAMYEKYDTQEFGRSLSGGGFLMKVYDYVARHKH